MEEELIE